MTDEENSMTQSRLEENLDESKVETSSQGSRKQNMNTDPSTADNTNSSRPVNQEARGKEQFDEAGNESSLAPLGGEFQTPAKTCAIGSAKNTKDNHFVFEDSMMSKKNIE